MEPADPRIGPAKADPEAGGPLARRSSKTKASDDRELREIRNRLAEALDQQVATSAILRVINRSPTEAQPVFETIVESAGRLCSAESAAVYRFEGDMAYFVAGYHFSADTREAYRRQFPRPLRETDHLQRVLDGAVLNIADIETDPHTSKTVADIYRDRGVHSTVFVPMVREGRVIGAISVSHHDVDAFSGQRVELLKTFADQAVIAIENVRLFEELEARNCDLSDALEQQTATAEILRVISTSPTDLQPVLDAVVQSAARFCGAEDASLFRVDGERLRPDAHHGPVPQPAGLLIPVVKGTVGGRTVLERRLVHVADLQAESEDFPEGSAFARQVGHRTTLSVPLMREGTAIGVIQLRRAEVNPFTDKQIALLETFAHQAVIAIENVRLFTELQEKNAALTRAHAQVTEALEQQTATAEILRAIAASPTEIQPVLDTIARNAAHVCGAVDASLGLLDGDTIRIAARFGPLLTPVGFELPLDRRSLLGRAIVDVGTIHVDDTRELPETEYPLTREFSRRFGHRSVVATPLLREGAAIGALFVRRTEVRPFSESEIELLKTFADQAVIAIENVRLFTELQEKNHALTAAHAQISEALEQQTATADILSVISRSPTDVQPVFDAIVESATRLCGASLGHLFQFDGEFLFLAAQYNSRPELDEALRRFYPMRPSRGQVSGRAVVSRTVVQIPDVFEDPEYRPDVAAAVGVGWRSRIGVPLLREGLPIGVIVINRNDPGFFAERHVELLKTFAGQAVIAIENVRLFTELQARTEQLTRSVDKLTALDEVSRALSSTLDLEAVLQTIVSRASQLAGADGCAIYEYEERTEEFQVRATHNFDASFVNALRATPLRKGEGAMGRATESREPLQIADIAAPGAYHSRVRGVLIEAGYHAVISVPMLLEEQVIGSLSLVRKTPGEFPVEVVELLRNFATQSALAIQNARLFQEIEHKSRQLEAASRHKSEFLSNMSHELRTPLNAIIGFSEVLAERMFGELSEKQEEYLKDIMESGRHLLSLINDILDLSKIEAGRMELELTHFHLPAALDNVLALVRERAGRRGIALRLTVDERLGQIRADERKIRQVVLNLLSNAIKFTPEGGKIDVRAALRDDVVEVSVSDTGIGIAPEDQGAVFEEFRQVGTAAKKMEGTGLGLALCRKFVELHGGTIWLTSVAGAGSTFFFTIPRVAS